MRAYYSATVLNFLKTSDIEILGQLMMKHQFSNDQAQKDAWAEQIKILKQTLSGFPEGIIYFEFVIPRLGKRADVILILNGIIFVIEFKNFQKEYTNTAVEQVIDYALDLKNFHSGSHNKTIIPILISTEANDIVFSPIFSEDMLCCCLKANKHNLTKIISEIAFKHKAMDFSPIEWENSEYKPTPTIVEAAQNLYAQHTVKDIIKKEAENLSSTTDVIGNIIKYSKQNQRKSICFITGIPGAGKTLAGLNIATNSMNYEQDEHAVFLSGNGPLVFVLREALIRDKAKKDNISKKKAEPQVCAFIQNIHHFRDEYFRSKQAPCEKVVIFDEAQRAWNKEQASKFMCKKHRITEFNFSEPEFLIDIMNRHQDWCVIICLVGGGQEINTGEAGISEWFKSLNERFSQWDIYCAKEILGQNYLVNEVQQAYIKNLNIRANDSLHLKVSLRSYRSEKLSDFVSYIIDNKPEQAKLLFKDLEDKYPIRITRNFYEVKQWIKQKSRGSERYGMLASAGGYRLKAEGINIKAAINSVHWLLENKNDVRSSYFLEDVATEFDIQGLELDWTIVCWDANLRYENNNWFHYIFNGTRWRQIQKEDNKKYLLNAYRVLLTRARQGMIIFVPEGSGNDPTANPDFYNGIYNYLLSCGIKELCPSIKQEINTYMSI